MVYESNFERDLYAALCSQKNRGELGSSRRALTNLVLDQSRSFLPRAFPKVPDLQTPPFFAAAIFGVQPLPKCIVELPQSAYLL